MSTRKAPRGRTAAFARATPLFLLSLLLPVLSATLPSPVRANASEGGGLWTSLVTQGSFGFIRPELARLRGWFDLQGRFRSSGESFEALLIRPGLGFALTDRIHVFVGYGWVETDPPGRKPFDEHRPWYQLTWNLPVEGFTLQSRTRLEQRIIDEQTGWRLREFVKTTVPWPAESRLFLSVFDELFFDLDDTDFGQRAGLRQNRAFAGLGWHLDERRRLSFEGGYMNQWIDRRVEDRVVHILSLNLFYNF